MKNAEALLERIKTKRREVADYLDNNEPKQSRYIMISIVAGTLAAALTAGLGFGESGFIDTASGLFSYGIPVWQVLCLLATLLSMSAVNSNGLLKSNDLTSKISQVRGCDAKFEGQEIMLDMGQIELNQATSL